MAYVCGYIKNNRRSTRRHRVRPGDDTLTGLGPLRKLFRGTLIVRLVQAPPHGRSLRGTGAEIEHELSSATYWLSVSGTPISRKTEHAADVMSMRGSSIASGREMDGGRGGVSVARDEVPDAGRPIAGDVPISVGVWPCMPRQAQCGYGQIQ
jgi:hypothetical protein